MDQVFPGVPRQRTTQQSLVPLKQALTLEDMLQRADFPVKFLTPVPLRDIKIPGLDKNSLDLLGFNYFVAVDNTPFPDMSSLYRANRLRGKSNFVTVDSIMHPYMAFSNRVLADAIESHISPELTALLKSILASTLNDYEHVNDKEVRQDIEHNIAYLSVALKLLDPQFTLPEKGNSAQLAVSDLKSIKAGVPAESEIFGYEEDFSNYVPQGWYNTTPALQNFYRAREWVSHMGYPLTESVSSDTGGSVNNFRRSILLYRSLEEATVKATPAYESWKKLYQCWMVLGCFEGYQGNKVILPDQYQVVLKGLPSDLKVSLDALAEPLYRAKLMLAIKRETSSGLRSSSILALQRNSRAKQSVSAFALFPPAGDPEWPWIKAVARNYVDQDEGTQIIPISLSCLQQHGAPQANNVMLERIGRLNPAMVALLPELGKLIGQDGGNGNAGPSSSSREWQILRGYFKFPGVGAQNVLRTDCWMSRRLESAFAAWVDGHLSIAPQVNDTETAGTTPGVSSEQAATGKPSSGQAARQAATSQASPAAHTGRTNSSAGAYPGPGLFSSYTEEALALTRNNTRKQAYFHYLEPSPESYQAILEDAQRLSRQLGSLGYLSTADAHRFLEFISLCRRLERIAVTELKDQALPVGDLKLLGNIDRTMAKVDVPLAGILYVPGKYTDDGRSTGVNLALGHPAQVYLILQLGDRVWLARGALYSFYEIGGGHISALHWQRKLDFSLLHPPFWADKFDVVVQSVDSGEAAAKSKGSRTTQGSSPTHGSSANSPRSR